MKSLFNFYLDDTEKQMAVEKLNRLTGENSKGKLAALLRVFVKLFINTPDEDVDKDLLEAIVAEYEYCKLSNKRSKM